MRLAGVGAHKHLTQITLRAVRRDTGLGRALMAIALAQLECVFRFHCSASSQPTFFARSIRSTISAKVPASCLILGGEEWMLTTLWRLVVLGSRLSHVSSRRRFDRQVGQQERSTALMRRQATC